ncbi:MAG TPA: hypothetical protein VGW78_06485 [Candidatus Babeliales bacterium]|nr:hypothetical protein [Candidatus Babeliales bacterium]
MKYIYLLLLLPLNFQAMNFNSQQENRYQYHNTSLIPLALTPEEKNMCIGITGGITSFAAGEAVGIPLYLKGISTAGIALGIIPASFMVVGGGLTYCLYKRMRTNRPTIFVDVESNNFHIQKPRTQCMHSE